MNPNKLTQSEKLKKFKLNKEFIPDQNELSWLSQSFDNGSNLIKFHSYTDLQNAWNNLSTQIHSSINQYDDTYELSQEEILTQIYNFIFELVKFANESRATQPYSEEAAKQFSEMINISLAKLDILTEELEIKKNYLQILSKLLYPGIIKGNMIAHDSVVSRLFPKENTVEQITSSLKKTLTGESTFNESGLFQPYSSPGATIRGVAPAPGSAEHGLIAGINNALK